MTINRLICIDGISALLSACFTGLLKSKLSPIFNLPEKLLTILMVVSFCYAVYSLSLAKRASKSLEMVKILVVGNSIYAIICGVLIGVFYHSATFWGIGYLGLESFFVATLAFLEAKKIKDFA